jgi:hypothetical protein
MLVAGGPPGRYLGYEERGECGVQPGGGAHLAGRRRVLALLLGLDRLSQGRRAPAPRHGRVHGDVAKRCWDRADRRGVLRRQASSPMAWATPATSRCRWARRPCCIRIA